ncbi:fibronectin type III domain-containing protein [Nocardia pseudovaccinii]|uniref:fibronectin type III domain-containing protein n=1 Tax=Nocardia pseudovaccinii TaxID=189540 RepID=UPI0007A4E604|nr:fibronectin type III domain-containing protein [Nocardia pseudovaccinii]
MTGTTWDTLFGGDVNNVFKGQFGFALVRDYDPTKSLANFTPFDTLTGDWSATLLTTDAFNGCGYFDENGLEFNPTLATADTKAWQSRQKLLTDITDDSESAMFTAIERTPIIEALETNLPLAAMSSIGSVGYQYTKPKVTVPIHRQFVFGAIYAGPLGLEGWARIYPNALMVKPDKLSMNAKTEAQGKLTCESYPDSVSGFAVRTLREGPGWRAKGGTTGTPGTPTATAGGSAGTASMTFTAPTTPNGPFTYNVFVDASTTPVSSGTVTVSGTTSNPILTVTGLTAGSHTFKVQAVGSNLSGSAKTAASNSVTVT